MKSVFSEEQKLLVASLKKEMEQLLSSEREYCNLEEQFLSLEANFRMEESELTMIQADFQCRSETDVQIIESLKREIDDQKNIL